MTASTLQLTRAIAAGDAGALAVFYRERFDMMYAEARRATGCDEAFCLDVVHDAMLRVVRKLPVIETEEGLRAWTRRTVRSCAYDLLRQEGRRRAREARVAAARPSTSVDRPDDDLEARLAWLRRELEGMDEATRAIVTMRHRFGWTLARIAARAGLGTGAVDGRLRRALSTLGERGKEDFDG